jgi:hypothetical protein
LTPISGGGRNIGVTFSLHKPEVLSARRWNHIVRHFTRLDLIERYNEIGNDELSEVFENAREFLDNGGPRKRVRRFIRSGAARFATDHGAGYWRAALRKQIAASPALFAWLGR